MAWGVPSEPIPPTSASLGFPTPFSPWHAWHLATYTDAPCVAVPRPGGSPAPSGAIVISQAAMSRGAIGCPKRGACASAGTVTRDNAAKIARRSSVDIGGLPVLVDRPAGNRVVVIGAAQAPLRGE